MRDLQLLVAAGALAALPLPSSVLTMLFGALLLGQLAGLATASVRVVGLLQDAVLLYAVLLGAAFWHHSGNPWPESEDLGVFGLALGIAGNALYLKWMIHHQHAHEQMAQQAEERLTFVLGNIRADREAGLTTAEQAAAKEREFTHERDQVLAICALGRQAGGQALLQVCCLALALAGSPSEGVFLVWTAGVALPGLVNSKVQDLLLHPYLPKESRLC